MIRINLLEEDRLRKEPLEASEVGEEAFNEEVEQPESESAESQQPTPEDEPSVKIPRSKKRSAGTPPKKRKPQQPPLARGPSTSVILFLLVIAIGVTTYFIFFNKPGEMPPVPVLTDTTTRVVEQETADVTEPADKVPTPVTEQAEPAPLSTEREVPVYLPQNMAEIQHVVSLGKKKLEAAYRLLNNVQTQSQLRFLSIGNQHLAMSTLTNSRTFANRVRRQITNTSIVRNIELFDVQGVKRDGYKAEVNVYGNLKPQDEMSDPRDPRQTDIGNVHRELKEWVAIPTIELVQWNTTKVTRVNGWNRGPLFIQMEGSYTGIIRVIHALKNHGYNFSVSKIYVSTPYEISNSAPVYSLKLYLTLFGKASV